jgi:N-acetylated-alpha-linked acidic dipeptidase
MLLVLAEALAQLARDGCAPRRSIMIAHWDAEEYGILGSIEWVRQLEEELRAGAVAYINADAAATGALRGFRLPLPQDRRPGGHRGRTPPRRRGRLRLPALPGPVPRGPRAPIGTLGGGSDHVGFVTYIGIPSANLTMSSPTPIYHSIYDSFAWYERFADPEFVSGPTLAMVNGVLALRLANADLLPYDVDRYATDLKGHMDALQARARALGATVELGPLEEARTRLATAADAFARARESYLTGAAAGTEPTPRSTGFSWAWSGRSSTPAACRSNPSPAPSTWPPIPSADTPPGPSRGSAMSWRRAWPNGMPGWPGRWHRWTSSPGGSRR